MEVLPSRVWVKPKPQTLNPKPREEERNCRETYDCLLGVWFLCEDLNTYDLQANCWFSVEMCGVRSNTCLTHLVMTPATRTVFSFGAQDTELGADPVSSDVYRLSPLITYVSFVALRNQVESMSEIINASFDSQSEGVGKAIRKMDALVKRLETIEREVEGLRSANEDLSRQLGASRSLGGGLVNEGKNLASN